MSQGAGTVNAGPTPRRLSALALALAPWLAGACAEEEDPLSAEVLQQIGRSQGDAVGSERAGVYLLAGDAGPCDCPEVGGLDLCGALAFDAPAWPAQVYQHEGLMVLDIAPVLTLYGRLDADGAFIVDSRGLVVAASGLLGADVVEETGARLIIAFEQGDLALRSHGKALSVTVELESGWLVGMRVPVRDDDAGFIVGIAGPLPLTHEARRKIAAEFTKKALGV